MKTERVVIDATPIPEPLRPTKRQKTVNYVVGAALALVGVAVAVFLYWMFTGKDVLKINNNPVPVKPSFVKSEEKITISIDYCKSMDVPGVVYTRFVSKNTELVVPTTMENTTKGCAVKEFAVPIPSQLTPDVWHLNYRIDYKTNPISTVREEFNTQDFTVE